MRTTLDIDASILKELKALQRQRGHSLGRLVSDLLAQALKGERLAAREPEAPEWITRPMQARVDLADKDAVHDAMDRDSAKGPKRR
jgi:hypothetical protein